MRHVKYFFLILVFNFLCLGCQSQKYASVMTVLAPLPDHVKEASGLAHYGDGSVWLVEDSGNEDVLCQIDFNGKLAKTFKVKNARNEDWEDLTTDAQGNLYIGDFGNNDNKRKDLTIYKLPNPVKELGKRIEAEKIEFYYPDQKKFPPKKSKRFFDAEAFFHWNDSLYIITRNRSKPFRGETSIYKIPDVPGEYEAEKLGEFVLCDSPRSACAVTSAAISKDGKRIALLTYGNLWVFEKFTMDDFSNGQLTRIPLNLNTQQEAVTFMDTGTVLIADEKTNAGGGQLYRLNIEPFLQNLARKT